MIYKKILLAYDGVMSNEALQHAIKLAKTNILLCTFFA